MSHFTGPGYEFHLDVPVGWKLIRDDEYYRMQAAQIILSDLDRCEHGRHRGDVCSGASGCNGPSHGNPFLTPGKRIGTNISRRPIVMPDTQHRADLGDPALWLPSDSAPGQDVAS